MMDQRNLERYVKEGSGLIGGVPSVVIQLTINCAAKASVDL